MSWRDRGELVLLSAIWGSSFLFLRVAAPEFGPLVLIEVRVAVAAVFLCGVLAWRRELGLLRGHAKHYFFLGAVNSALPFSLFAFAALSLPAGYSSVLNATTPLFGALVGFLWLRERMASLRVLGLALGFAGVIALVWHKLSLDGDRLAVLAGLSAALCYGLSAHYTKRNLTRSSPLAISAGSLIAASIVLLPLACLALPERMPSTQSWLFAVLLGVLCTGVAYILFFRLLAHVGPARAMTVTYLIPLFGILWGSYFLAEPIGWITLFGGMGILSGVMLVAKGGVSAK